MKQSFKSTLKQTPSFSPQQQQAVKILQLNSAQLSKQIQQELESNPFLEALEESASQHSSPIKNRQPKPVSNASSRGNQPTSNITAKPNNSPLVNDLESLESSSAPLQAHLHAQAILTPMSERQHHAVGVLIDCIEESGYLSYSLPEIVAHTRDKESLSIIELETALDQVQNLEPHGVGARDLTECLNIQLRNIDPPSPTTVLAQTLVKHHLPLIGRYNPKSLSEALGVDKPSIQQAIALIKSLDPKPGAQIESATTMYISADIIAAKRDGQWRAELTREHIPQIALSSYTQDWLDQIKEPTKKKPLLEQANRAKMLVSQVESRYQTTLKVAAEIIERQQAYFENGNIALQPLTLKQIAESLNIHISTVSRTINGKYLQSNKGLVELKSFFSTSISSLNGKSISARSVQATIENMIEEEPPSKPLSDNKIAQQLNKAGLLVARRTVAKYREQMKIPASSVRRQLSNPSDVTNSDFN